MIGWDLDEQRRLLLLDTRQQILEAIYRKPGIHFRELERATGLATGQLEYHLDRMIRAGLIVEQRDGRYTRYYPPMEERDGVLKVLQYLHREKVRMILTYLVENRTASAEELREIAELSPSALTWHMNRLIEAGIVEKVSAGKRAEYRLKKPEIVARALQIHREGMLDRLADRLAELWEW